MTPPALPSTFTLDTTIFTRDTLHRVYWKGTSPIEPSRARDNRYDCPASLPAADQFGVLYLGYDLTTCWMETVVRVNMVRPAGSHIQVPLDKMKKRWACEVNVGKPLTLATFADEPLIHLGECASNIMGDSYLRTRHWAQLLHAHANPAVDGLLYRSRFNTSAFCIALFERGIVPKGVRASYGRSINPATSKEVQAIMRKYQVVPI